MNRKINIILISLLSCFILMFCILGFFNHPQSDDYSFALALKQFGFIGAQKYWYLHWSGRFFANFISSLQPITAKIWFIYKILPSVLILTLVFSIYYFIKPFLKIKNNNLYSVIFALSIVLIWLIQTPALAETLYWFTGSVNYILPIPFLLFLISMLFKYKSKVTFKQSILSFIAILILLGSSELYLIFVIFWIGLWLFLRIQFKNFKFIDGFLISEFLILVAFVLISSGNQYRSSIVDTCQNPIGVISYSLFYSLRFLVYEFENGSIILFMLLCFPFINKSILLLNSLKFRAWLFVYFLIFIWISIAFVVWFTSDKVPSRYISTLHFIFVIAIPLFIYSIISEKWLEKVHLFGNYKSIKWIALALFVLILILPGRSTLKFNHPMHGNLYSVSKILLNGDAYRFDLEMKKRYEIFQTTKNSECVVPSINYPKDLVYMDLLSDTANWFNVKVAGVWNLKSVRVDKDDDISHKTQRVTY